jgi:hypothetical protein
VDSSRLSGSKATKLKAQILVISLLCSSVIVGCRMQPAAGGEDGTAATQSSEDQTTGMVTLAFGKEGNVAATIETLKDSVQAIPGSKPRAKLLIKNLSTGKMIYEEECGDSNLSNPGFWIEKGAALLMTTKGGSGDGISVYEVSESGARIVLAKSYRAVTVAMPNDELGGNAGFLIVDAEHATDPLEITRYEYSSEKREFVATGKANFAQFMKSVSGQFRK